AALPRVRIAHVAVGERDEAGVISTVNDPAIDLRRTVVLPIPAPALASCDGGSARVVRYRPASVTLRVDVPCRSMVVLGDAWFPGWKALVDGRAAQIYPAYNVVRGVVVEAGPHEVAVLYRPRSVFGGALLALLGMIICVAL